MTRKERQRRRAVAIGEVYRAKRKAPMPSPKIIPLKTRYNRHKRTSPDEWSVLFCIIKSINLFFGLHIVKNL